MMRGKAISAVILLVVVLCSGVGIGVALGRSWLSPAPAKVGQGERAKRMIERFRKELGLDAAQVAKVSEAVARAGAAQATLRASIEPQLQKVREALRAEVSAQLTAEQRTRYVEMVKRYEARRAAAAK